MENNYESYLNFKKNVEQFVICMNRGLGRYACDDGDYDSTINSVARVCSRELSLVLDENDLVDNHNEYDQEDSLYCDKVPRCHYVFPRNYTNTMIACVTTVTSGFIDTFGGYVGYIPNNLNNVPIFFLESISDKNYTHTCYEVSPLEANSSNIWYDRK
jgi:hypothetical protein